MVTIQKGHRWFQKQIKRLSLTQITIIMLLELVLLPIWVCILYVNNTSVLGWSLMGLFIIPTFSIMGYWDNR